MFYSSEFERNKWKHENGEDMQEADYVILRNITGLSRVVGITAESDPDFSLIREIKRNTEWSLVNELTYYNEKRAFSR